MTGAPGREVDIAFLGQVMRKVAVSSPEKEAELVLSAKLKDHSIGYKDGVDMTTYESWILNDRAHQQCEVHAARQTGGGVWRAFGARASSLGFLGPRGPFLGGPSGYLSGATWAPSRGFHGGSPKEPRRETFGAPVGAVAGPV